MLDQMMILHDCESLVTRFRDLKIERLEQRIREAEKALGGEQDGT